MYQGSYLFGNRIVTHKFRTSSTTQLARGSASFVCNGETITRRKRVKSLNDTLFDLRALETFKQQELCKLYKQAQNLNSRFTSFAEVNLLYHRITETEKELADITKKIKIQELAESAAVSKPKSNKSDAHQLNKAKVRDKCTAFFELEVSQKFCAFYSVSFPKGMHENVIYKCWNSWLTNLRKTYGLKDYIWIAEYQQNGTLHYHMLCNVRMDIKRVNRAMGICLFHQGELKTEIEKYNGVDVQRVNGNREALNGYLTKYVSKQDSYIYKHSPWRCSQSVSALFTSCKIDAKTSFQLVQDLAKHTTQIYENDYAVVEYFNVKDENGHWYNLPNQYREKIIQLNNLIIKQLEREKYEKIHRDSIQREISPLQVSERDETRQIGGVVQLSLFQSYCN